MAADQLIFDVDSHITENLPRLHELTDAKYRGAAPRIIDQGASELLFLGGLYVQQPPGVSWADTNTRGGFDPAKRTGGKWVESESVGFDPKARLAMMDEHGVAGSVLFPSIGLFCGTLPDPEVAAGVCRGVNRYIAEFCSADPARLKNTATVPIADVKRAQEEARYAVKELGAAAIFSPSGVHGPYPVYHPHYDAFFDTIAELGVPYITHTGAAAMVRGLGVERYQGRFPPFHITSHMIEAELACLGVLAYGVLDKRPELKIGFFEAGAAWAPAVVHKITEKYEHMGWMMPELSRSPLEVFKRQCLVTVESDEALLDAVLDYFDGGCVGWSSDVPHFDCEDEGRPDALVNNRALSERNKRGVLADNGLAFFGLTEAYAARRAAE